jgi:hypothetical protein
MLSVVPIVISLTDQLQIRFVDQSGRLKRVISALAPHERGSPPVKLVIYQRQESVGDIGIAAIPLMQQLRDVRANCFIGAHGQNLIICLLSTTGNGGAHGNNYFETVGGIPSR